MWRSLMSSWFLVFHSDPVPICSSIYSFTHLCLHISILMSTSSSLWNILVFWNATWHALLCWELDWHFQTWKLCPSFFRKTFLHFWKLLSYNSFSHKLDFLNWSFNFAIFSFCNFSFPDLYFIRFPGDLAPNFNLNLYPGNDYFIFQEHILLWFFFLFNKIFFISRIQYSLLHF